MKALILIGMFLSHLAWMVGWLLPLAVICLIPGTIGWILTAVLDSAIPGLIGMVITLPWMVSVTTFDWNETSNKAKRITSKRGHSDE